MPINGWGRPFDLAQSQTIAKADKFFAAGYLATGDGRTSSGEDHKVGGRALRSRPQEVVPRCSTGKQQASGLHEGAHPRCVISMPSDAC